MCYARQVDVLTVFLFSSRRRHTSWTCDWSSDVCSSDLDRRGLPAAEGLAADDRSGDGAVDVEVAGLDAVHPARDLAIVQRLDATGEAERLRVGELDRLIEVLGPHQPQHGAEAFRAVKEGAGTHT